MDGDGGEGHASVTRGLGLWSFFSFVDGAGVGARLDVAVEGVAVEADGAGAGALAFYDEASS